MVLLDFESIVEDFVSEAVKISDCSVSILVLLISSTRPLAVKSFLRPRRETFFLRETKVSLSTMVPYPDAIFFSQSMRMSQKDDELVWGSSNRECDTGSMTLYSANFGGRFGLY